MSHEEILNLEYKQFIDFLTGTLLMRLGEGIPVRDSVGFIVMWTILWDEKKRKEKDAIQGNGKN